MNKRERLVRTFAGEPTDRTPVSFWRHWPGDDQRAADFARVLIDFQRKHDLDFMRILPASNWLAMDHGLQDEWRGALDGTRHVTRHVVQRSLDWSGLRPLTPLRGVAGRQLQALRLVLAGLDDDTPVLISLPSPLAQADQLAGRTRLLRHMRMSPERLRAGLEMLTSSTLRIIDELRPLPLAGICYELSLASHDILSMDEYRTFGWAFDQVILGNLPGAWWFNMASFPASSPMFRLAGELTLAAVNWEDQPGSTGSNLWSLPTRWRCLWRSRRQGAFARRHARHDSESGAHSVATLRRSAAHPCTRLSLLVTTPQSNLHALRQAVEPGGNVA